MLIILVPATIATPILFINSTYSVVYVQSLIAPFCGQAQSEATVVVKTTSKCYYYTCINYYLFRNFYKYKFNKFCSWYYIYMVVSGQSKCTGAFDSNGDFISQVLTATSAINSYVDYLVTPTADGCVGISQSIRINVSPSPEVVATNL